MAILCNFYNLIKLYVLIFNKIQYVALLNKHYGFYFNKNLGFLIISMYGFYLIRIWAFLINFKAFK